MRFTTDAENEADHYNQPMRIIKNGILPVKPGSNFAHLVEIVKAAANEIQKK